MTKCLHCGAPVTDDGQEIIDLCPSCTDQAQKMGAHLLVSLHVIRRCVEDGKNPARPVDAAIGWVR